MHSFTYTAVTFLSLSSTILAAPAQFSARMDQNPMPDIAAVAGGNTPNTAPPTGISDAATADFQAVNFLENLESAFFAAGIKNLTAWNKDGYLDEAIKVVTAVHAQELIHVETAEAILKANNKATFSPCQYTFPVTTAAEFLNLASIITTVGIGGVINIVSGLALSDPKLVQGPASILAIESRHDAFFRQQISKNLLPNPAPFDTRLSARYALNLAAPFLVKDSCKAKPAFKPLPGLKAEVKGATAGTKGPITFTFGADVAKADYEGKTMYIGWVNQANKVAYTAATVTEGKVESTIAETAVMGGIAFAALTGQNQAVDVNALTDVTVAGPAPVRIS